MEIWKDVEGFEGLYQVSDIGNVRSITRYKKILKSSKDKDGYKYVKLKHKGVVKHCRICRLVASAFIPHNENKNQVNHIDTNRLNDNVKNLEWCTIAENIRHSALLGHYKGKGTKKVKQFLGDSLIKEWESISEAAEKLNISLSNISKCANGKRNTAGGYKWVYISKIGERNAMED